MSHIPTYAYILFLVLLWMGIARCFPRTVRLERLLFMPALIAVLSLRGFLGLFPAPMAKDLLAALVGGFLGIAMGWRHVRHWTLTIDRATRRITMPGDVMMLAVIMGTFAFEFALHYGIEAQAHWAAVLPTELLSAAVWAWFVGMSAGRNLNIARRYRLSGSVPS